MKYPANTTIYLCEGVPFDENYSHVRLFDNESQRLNYLRGKTVKTLENSTYQRDNFTVKFPIEYDFVCQVNYLYYRNPEFSNRWFYGFVTDIRYVNEGTTELDFKIDMFQTWWDYASKKPMFIERQHVNNDTPGANLIPEGLETGEYVYNRGVITGYGDVVDLTPCIVLGVSEILEQFVPERFEHMINNSYSGLAYFYADIDRNQEVTDIIETYATSGKADAIVTMFMYPREFLGLGPGASYSGWIGDGQLQQQIGGSLDNPYAPIDTYVPKNKKLYTYPYRYLMLYGSGGGANEYRYEDFNSYSNMFTVFSNLGGNSPIVAVPNGYKHKDIGLEYSTVMNPYPNCSWVTDTFKNWYAQNQRSLMFSNASALGTGALGIITAAATGNVVAGGMAVYSGIHQVLQNVTAVEQHKVLPDSAHGNTASANAYYANGQHYFYMFPMCIKAEFARVIDNFFSLYGYKVNVVDLPNFRGRKSWNYVKVVDANLSGYIPVDALRELKSMLERGTTFWHTDDMLNYNLDNSIL